MILFTIIIDIIYYYLFSHNLLYTAFTVMHPEKGRKAFPLCFSLPYIYSHWSHPDSFQILVTIYLIDSPISFNLAFEHNTLMVVGLLRRERIGKDEFFMSRLYLTYIYSYIHFLYLMLSCHVPLGSATLHLTTIPSMHCMNITQALKTPPTLWIRKTDVQFNTHCYELPSCIVGSLAFFFCSILNSWPSAVAICRFQDTSSEGRCLVFKLKCSIRTTVALL